MCHDTQLVTCISSRVILVITTCTVLCLYALVLLALLMTRQQPLSSDKNWSASRLWWHCMCQQPIRGAPCEQTHLWYSVSKPTAVALYLQTHRGGTLSANPLRKPTLVVLYQQTHSGGTLSANPLRWCSICKPTPVVRYQQTHSSGTLSANPLLLYTLSANPLW